MTSVVNIFPLIYFSIMVRINLFPFSVWLASVSKHPIFSVFLQFPTERGGKRHTCHIPFASSSTNHEKVSATKLEVILSVWLITLFIPVLVDREPRQGLRAAAAAVRQEHQ